MLVPQTIYIARRVEISAATGDQARVGSVRSEPAVAIPRYQSASSLRVRCQVVLTEEANQDETPCRALDRPRGGHSAEAKDRPQRGHSGPKTGHSADTAGTWRWSSSSPRSRAGSAGGSSSSCTPPAASRAARWRHQRLTDGNWAEGPGWSRARSRRSAADARWPPM